MPPYTITPSQGIGAALEEMGLGDTVQVIYNTGKDTTEASALAASCSLAIVVVATISGEVHVCLLCSIYTMTG